MQVRKDIEEIVSEIGALPKLKTLAMTTNGIVLARKLPVLRKAGLNQLNISLDTLIESKFDTITRRTGFGRVLEAINLALELGYNPLKINCVVMKGFNDMEIPEFVEMTRTKPIEVRFIELMPFDGNSWTDRNFVSYKDMIGIISADPRFDGFARAEDPGPNETAKTWKVPGFVGQVGFITSMSDHFCGTCNRLRITADGNLKVCLFGSSEVSLRDAMRLGYASDAQLASIIDAAVKRKKAHHGGMYDMYEIAANKNRPMILIGG